jgi:hypothetical protein
MAAIRTQWQLRFRSPLSETKGVDDVLIETPTDDYTEAKKLADWALATKFPSPGTRFVFLRKSVIATSEEMAKALAPAPPAKPASNERVPDRAQAASRSNVPPRAPGAGSNKEQRPTDFGAGAAEDPDDKQPAAGRGRVGA